MINEACIRFAVEPLPAACFGLIAQVKMYELLTVEAAVHGDRNAAYQALLTYPLGPKADQVQAVLDDMLETNKQWLPQFKQSSELTCVIFWVWMLAGQKLMR